MKWPELLAFLLLPAAIPPVVYGQTEYAQTPVSSSTLTVPILSTAAPTAPAPVLAQIQILGLKNVTETEVRAMLQAKEWAPYPKDVQDKDITALLTSGRFTDVKMQQVALSSAALRLDIFLTEGTPKPAPAPTTVGRLASSADEVPLPPWVIGDVQVKGNQNVKASVIRAQIKGRKGDLYDRPDLDRDIQNIMNLGSFERVAADLSLLRDQPVPERYLSVSPSSFTVRVAFLVEEKPLIQKIQFTGNKEISKGKLKDETTLRPKDPFDRVKLRTDADKVLELYHKKGFHRASVEPKVNLDTATRQADINYVIEEGPKARIVAVLIDGVRSFKPKKVAKQMKNRRKKVFDEKQLTEDLKKIEDFYKNQGYLDYHLIDSSVTYNQENTSITIHIALQEGPQYRHGDTTFSGYTLYSSSTLAKALEYRKGKIFSQEKFNFSITGIQEMYAELGRLRTKVIPEKIFNSTSGLMDVHFTIEESNIVYVDHVDVEGNKATKTYVLKREIVLKPGMPFSMSKFKKSQERLMNLGFLDDVVPDVQSPVDPEKADITYEVVEGKPGALTAGAGFSSLDGLVGTLSLQHLNLFGRAQRAAIQWSFGSRVQDYSLSWTTPWINNKPTSLGFDLFNTRRLSPFESSSSAFTNKRLGGSVRVGPRFQDDKYQLAFNYTFQKITITNVQTDFANILQESTSIQSTIGLEAARDTRDNFLDPTRGSRNSIGISLAGGPLLGDIDFLKPFITNSYNHTLTTYQDYPLVLSFSNRAGYVTPFGSTKVIPVFERFFIGGQDTLRGYNISGEAGTPDGGKVYDVFNVELGYPLARERRRTIVKFVTFFDAGGSWDNTRAVNLRIGPGTRDVKTDVGFGIRFTTPAFPIRLDWGYGLNHRTGEQKYQINFGIGNLF